MPTFGRTSHEGVLWGSVSKRSCGRATFAGPIWPPKHSALVYGPKWFKHLPDVLICLLLSQHPHKELPVFWGRSIGGE